MSERWVKATLADDDPAIKQDPTRDRDVFINVSTAGLIYRSEKGGSYVWFVADPRDHETAERVPWDGYISVQQSPERLLGIE
jgi:hypothetical protein